MTVNDQEIIKIISENYNDLTWTEINILINDLSDIVKPYIYQSVIDNPTPKMKSRVRELLSNIERKRKKKIKKDHQYTCCHYDCNEPSIQSHVISKSAILAPLANAKNEMYHFVSDINSTPTKCIVKARHIDHISSFPGYCKKHDEDIFRELDHGSSVNAKFVNLSAMRVLKKRIFDLMLKINLQGDQSCQWNDLCAEYINEQEDIDLISLAEENEFFIDMNTKIKAMKNDIKRYEVLYHNIFSKIEESTALIFNIMELKCVRSCFSIMVDIPLEDGSPGQPHFVFYLPINNQGYLIVAKENNGEDYDPMIINENGDLSLFFWMFILECKESIFFSYDILSIASDYQMKLLLTNYEFFQATALEGVAISNIYV